MPTTNKSQKTSKELINSFARISPEILYKNGSETIQRQTIIEVIFDIPN